MTSIDQLILLTQFGSYAFTENRTDFYGSVYIYLRMPSSAY